MLTIDKQQLRELKYELDHTTNDQDFIRLNSQYRHAACNSVLALLDEIKAKDAVIAKLVEAFDVLDYRDQSTVMHLYAALHAARRGRQ